MADLPPLPTPAQLLALAHTALLDQLDRADPAHALTSLLADLAQANASCPHLACQTAGARLTRPPAVH